MLLTNVNIKSCISECTNIDSGGIELSRVRGGVTERSKRLLQWHKSFGGTLGSILSDSESVSETTPCPANAASPCKRIGRTG